MTNSLRIVCLTVVVALAACKGANGGEPAPPSDVLEPERRGQDLHFEPIAMDDLRRYNTRIPLRVMDGQPSSEPPSP